MEQIICITENFVGWIGITLVPVWYRLFVSQELCGCDWDSNGFCEVQVIISQELCGRIWTTLVHVT